MLVTVVSASEDRPTMRAIVEQALDVGGGDHYDCFHRSDCMIVR